MIHHLWKHSYQHTNKYKMGICTVKLSPIMAYQIKYKNHLGHSHVHFNHIIFPMSYLYIDWYFIHIYNLQQSKISNFIQNSIFPMKKGTYIYFCTPPQPIPFPVSTTLVNSVNTCWKVTLVTIKQLWLS